MIKIVNSNGAKKLDEYAQKLGISGLVQPSLLKTDFLLLIRIKKL